MNDEQLKRLVTHFPSYLDYVYSNIGLPSSTPLQQRIAHHLNFNPERLILQAARGTGKSWIAAIYTTFRLLRNPDEKILIVSASGPKAIEIATFVRRLFEEVPLLQHLRPGPEQRDSVLSFDVAGSKVSIAPSVAAVGITSQITGRRASLVLADDVEVPSNSMTEMMREKLLQRTGEFEALLIPDMPSSIVYLGTPQSMESIYGKLDYNTVVLPAEVPENPESYEGKLDDWILEQGNVGEATDKVRFPRQVLLQRQAGMGLAGYKLQYMLDTTLSDAEKYPLKCSDLIVTSCDTTQAPFTLAYAGSPDYAYKELINLGFTGDRYHKPFTLNERKVDYDVKIMSVDPSGMGSDETTWAVLGVLNGYVYVLDVGGTKLGYSDKALMLLAQKAKEYQVNTIVLEKNWGGGMFTNLFEKIVSQVYPCTLDEVNVKGQKEVRIINSIEPLSSNHKLVFDYNLIKKDTEWASKEVDNISYSLLHQYTHITREKGCLAHDDRIDALATACEYIKDMVLVDADLALEAIKEQEMEQFLMEKIYGSYRPKKVYFHK